MTRLNLFDVESPNQPIRAIFDGDDLENVSIGDVIAPYDDYLLQWDEKCVYPSQLETWRIEGDTLSDQVVRELDLKPGQDGLQKILDHLDQPVETQSETVQKFWKEIARDPPETLTLQPISQYTPRITHCDRYPEPIISEGQAVFWRYATQVFSALLHYSLAGGFSANRLIGVLRETSYLTGEDRDRTYKRLLETTQAITDYMNDMTPISGRGWKSAIRVRLLHSTVRVRLEDKKGVFNTYDAIKDGVPINQEDMLATLGSFAIVPLMSLERQGVHLTFQEREAYVAVWRHIGYYLGIQEEKLIRHYSSFDSAAKLLACQTLHLFSLDTIPTDHRSTNTYRLLSSVANRPPRNAPVEHSLALSRFLLGDGLAERLFLPRSTLVQRMRLHFGLKIEKALVYFGRVYTQKWEIERISLTRLLVQMVVCWQLGVRRTKFTPKHVEPVLREKEEVDPDDDELDPEIIMGPAAGKAVLRRWRWLLVEMAAVVALPAVVVGLGGLTWYRVESESI